MHLKSILHGLCWLLLACSGVQATPAESTSPTILVVGDSISAAYGIRVEEGWVALLQEKLAAQGYGYRVVNASVSGETTAGGLVRLPRALQLHRPRVVILELGGNDGLRGLPLNQLRANLESMIEQSTAAGAHVVLAGMRMPPNYGPAYTQGFHRLFVDLARRHRVSLVPFLMEAVALDDALMQPDGIHPNARAQPVLLDTLWPALVPLLQK